MNLRKNMEFSLFTKPSHLYSAFWYNIYTFSWKFYLICIHILVTGLKSRGSKLKFNPHSKAGETDLKCRLALVYQPEWADCICLTGVWDERPRGPRDAAPGLVIKHVRFNHLSCATSRTTPCFVLTTFDQVIDSLSPSPQCRGHLRTLINPADRPLLQNGKNVGFHKLDDRNGGN